MPTKTGGVRGNNVIDTIDRVAIAIHIHNNPLTSIDRTMPSPTRDGATGGAVGGRADPTVPSQQQQPTTTNNQLTNNSVVVVVGA